MPDVDETPEQAEERRRRVPPELREPEAPEPDLSALREAVGRAQALQSALNDMGVGIQRSEALSDTLAAGELPDEYFPPPGATPTPQPYAPRPVSIQSLRLIGIGGRLRAGKDAVADRLVEKHGYAKTFMAETLAEALYRLNPIIDCYFEGGAALAAEVGWGTSSRYERYRVIADAIGYTEAKRIPEVRRLLQALGTEVGRELLGEDTWTTAARRRIEALWAEGQPVVITGIRFQNEADMVRALGGRLVWIERPSEAPQTPPRLAKTLAAMDEALAAHNVAQHASEVTLKADDFDYVIENTGTLDDLYERTAAMLAWTRSATTP